MSTSTPTIISDLADEIGSLDQLLQTLPREAWRRATPAPGWDVVDQVIHLGLFDRRALWSIVQPEVFDADRSDMMSHGGVEAIHSAERHRDPDELFQWWREGSHDLITSMTGVDLARRCSWYGPSMSAMSMLTARLMETWAHAHDIADAVGVALEPTLRLRHVAHIGVRAMPFAFASHKKDTPNGSVYVRLNAPDGSTWAWGDETASSSVSGDALGFCQAVTQRRHVDDCRLAIVGEPATTWMSIAQAFAGPPGVGRAKGQFD